MVDRASATLGLGRERERQIGLDADHARICKFSRADDPMYSQVEDNIAEMVNAAISKYNQTTEDPEDPAKNRSKVQGSRNNTIQYGKSNSSLVQGDVNQTHQYGHGNESKIEGGDNAVMQVSSSGVHGIWESLHSYFSNPAVVPWANNQSLERNGGAR